MNRNAVVAGAGVVVLVIGGYAAATAWTGQQTQVRYKEQLTRVQARMPFLRVTEQTYRKGFFSSTATTTLQFGCPTADGKSSIAATLTSTIHHGPLAGATPALAVVDSQLGFSGGDAAKVAAAFGGAAPLTVHTVVHFAGDATNTFQSPAAKVTLPKGGELAWQGLSGTADTSADARSTTYRLSSPGLTISDPASKGSLRIGAIALDGQGRATDDSGLLSVGKVQGSIDAIEFAAEAVKVALTGLKLTSETSLDGELLGGTGGFSGAGMFNDTKIDRFEMQTSLKRIHAPSYQRLMSSMTKDFYGCDMADKKAAMAAMQQKLQTDLMALLPYNPQISVDKIAIQSGGKTGELAYAVGVEGVTPADAALPPMALLMGHAQLTGSMRVPVEWLRQMSAAGASRLQGQVPDPATLDVLIEQAQSQGYVVRDGEYITAKADFSKGALTVNGKPLGGPPAAAAAAPEAPSAPEAPASAPR